MSGVQHMGRMNEVPLVHNGALTTDRVPTVSELFDYHEADASLATTIATETMAWIHRWSSAARTAHIVTPELDRRDDHPFPERPRSFRGRYLGRCSLNPAGAERLIEREYGGLDQLTEIA